MRSVLKTHSKHYGRNIKAAHSSYYMSSNKELMGKNYNNGETWLKWNISFIHTHYLLKQKNTNILGIRSIESEINVIHPAILVARFY